MAELVFNFDDVALTTSWTVLRGNLKTGERWEPYATDITSAYGTRSVMIDGIPEGEVVKRAILTATLNRTGTTDYGESLKANGLNFSTGSRKLDTSLFVNGSDMSIQFYFRASGNAGLEASTDYISSYSCTIYMSDITLTIITGTGSAFDGRISSLPEGTKIMIDEPGDTQGQYTLVNHDYNTGKALLWRDDAYTTSSFNDFSTKFIGGTLDNYLNTTFYEAMPDTTKAYIVSANYPTLTNHVAYGGTVENLERYVCAPSVRELFDGAGAAEGTLLMYLDTVPSASTVSYWTRSMVSDTSATNARYVNAAGNDYFSTNAGNVHGVRPCFCVLAEQLVVPSTDGTYYTLASAVPAPAAVYLNGVAADMNNQQRGASAVLSWDAVVNGLVTGYEVWSRKADDDDFTFFGAVTATDDGTIPTELSVYAGSKGFMSTFFKVKAVTTPDTDYLDSDLSIDARLIATKRTNVNYYDGVRWLLAAAKHYNGNAWEVFECVKYYDGIKWGPTNATTLTTAKLGIASVGYLILGEGE